MKKKLTAIPTNIITGFLGVGKTTAILNLLQQKPEDETWAVLVNEFGEVGIDGSLLQGQQASGGNIVVSEVPGGCMCCAAGLPMQIALNQLLIQAKPNRLIIEPTGLGHPIEVLNTLSSEHYQDVLNIEKVITLVDARQLKDERYTTHATFNQQIEVADVIVGNKKDLYQQVDYENLRAFFAKANTALPEIQLTTHGMLSAQDLAGATAFSPGHHHHHHSSKPINEVAIPESGYIAIQNEGEGFQSIGWRFKPAVVFDRAKILQWINTLEVERIKAVFITHDGIFSYNRTPDGLTEHAMDECSESRVEIIEKTISTEWEINLLSCTDYFAA